MKKVIQMSLYRNEFGDTGYDSRYDEYDFPLVAQYDARDLDELSILFEDGFEDVPFTAAEEEMLPHDNEAA
jgi:hypothetical protein